MVFANFLAERLSDLESHLASKDILIDAWRNPIRLVTHLDLDEAAIDQALDTITTFLG
jgi:threonine aldolase